MRVIQSLVKGLHILEYISSSEGGAKLTEVASRFNQPTSNLILFLNSFTQEGYLLKNPITGRYQLSVKFSELAQRARADLFQEIRQAAQPLMEKLHQKYNENILLSAFSGGKLFVVTEIKSTRSIQIQNKEADFFIPHVTAAGKAILAFQDKSDMENYHHNTLFKKLTQLSITSKTKLMEELKRTAEEGVAMNHGEYDEDVLGVAAPIFYSGQPVSSIVIQFPRFRSDIELIRQYRKNIKSVAEKITELIKN